MDTFELVRHEVAEPQNDITILALVQQPIFRKILTVLAFWICARTHAMSETLIVLVGVLTIR